MNFLSVEKGHCKQQIVTYSKVGESSSCRQVSYIWFSIDRSRYSWVSEESKLERTLILKPILRAFIT